MKRRSMRQTAELADLPVTDEQALQAKGGVNYTKIEFAHKPLAEDGGLKQFFAARFRLSR